MLEFCNETGYTAKVIYDCLVETPKKNKIPVIKCVAFCADNTNTNCGGVNMPDTGGNVFLMLKKIVRNMIPADCNAHIVHNSPKKAGEMLMVDAEAIITKLASHLQNEKSTKRIENVKEFCQFLNVEYLRLPAHGRTCCLTLQPIITRSLQLWEPLKYYFLSVDGMPRILVTFFS